MTKFTTAQYQQPGLDQPTFVLLLDDGVLVQSMILGDMNHVREAIEALTALVETGRADEEISHLDERLGYNWLSVSEAAQAYDVPVATVRRAAATGKIPMAKKVGRGWRFPEWKFRLWLERVYRPRGRTVDDVKETK